MNTKILVETDDKMRDEFHTLIESNGKYYIKSDGNVSPNRIGTSYIPIGEKTAKKISGLDIENAWDYMNEYTANFADECIPELPN